MAVWIHNSPAMNPSALLPLAILLTLLSPVAAAPSWSLQPGPAWQTSGKLKSPNDLSAVDTLNGRVGVIAGDEGSALQSVLLDPARRTISTAGNLRLLGKKQEADLEGIAAAPPENCYYVTGSHALSRKKQVLEDSRYHLFRVRQDPDSGDLQDPPDTTTLRPLLETFAELKPFLDQPAAADGLDVEGLAWRAGKLFVGFRAPVAADHAWILEADAASLFQGGKAEGRLHKVSLGPRMGIRALAAWKEGFLILSGDSGHGVAGDVPALFHWRPDTPAVRLGSVPVLPGAKPEGLSLLVESAQEVRLLLLSDGPAQGHPIELILTPQPQVP